MIKYFMISALFVSSSIFAADAVPEPKGRKTNKTWNIDMIEKNFLDLIDMQQHIATQEELELAKKYYYTEFYKEKGLEIQKRLEAQKGLEEQAELEKQEELKKFKASLATPKGGKKLIEFLKKRIKEEPSVLFLKDMCNLVKPIDFSDQTIFKMLEKASLEKIAGDLMPEDFFEKSELFKKLGKLKTARGIDMAVGLALSKYKNDLMSECDASEEKINVNPHLKGARIMRNQLIVKIMENSEIHLKR